MARAVLKIGGTLAVGLLITVSSARAANWVDQRTIGHFHLRANFALSDIPQLMTELQRLDHDLTTALELKATDEPVHLILFRDKTSYRHYIERYFSGAPDRRALFIKGSEPGWVLAYQNPQFEIDVRHEGTHALLHSRLPMVPLWLDEGLAEYYEVGVDERLYDNPHLSPTKWSARFYRVRPMRQLEELDDVRQMGKAEYRAAWSWVHFMLHGPPEARQALVGYLRDIANQVPPGLLSERLQLALPDYEKQYRRHFLDWRQP